ncbi:MULTISPECIES: SDR family oxidoreductase [unclassified Curtobacterium]|uniref:SDR family oxidoreductase n=1 Tax=unclassified Curtobacterium TaxID=257496 RepID=UPI00233051CC|nr:MULTISPECIES: SDR family oxidoreductase [unclassified Curtobacterium]MDB6427681.1 SDR family oxidoreductase [Curtobacterium sp. 20TX0008]MDT0210263.1 SDR family oxidoreductase [Curtobacterium sp. BRD11]
MSGPSVLFIGGSGIISAACVREAVEQGYDVTVLNRGTTDKRPIPDAVARLQADVSDRTALEAAIGDQHWDVVIDFVAFTPDQVQRDIEVFTGRTNQYVFISSASAYQTPATHLPITESTPLKNPFWQYSRDKIACEDLLTKAYREDDFPMTIIRPSHTYDETLVPFSGGWTVLGRMRAGKPIVVTGDGSSLWTITHARDFAVGFVGLLDRAEAIGEAFHITGDEAPTWDRIAHELAAAAGVEDLQLVHVPADAIDALDADWGASLLGDKANTSVFDNTKVQTLVPEFAQTTSIRQGAREIVAWFDADPSRQVTDERLDGLMDQLVERWQVR